MTLLSRRLSMGMLQATPPPGLSCRVASPSRQVAPASQRLILPPTSVNGTTAEVGYTSPVPAHTTRGIRVNKKSRTRLLIATGVIVVVFIVGVVFLVQKQGAYYRQVSDLPTGQYDGKNVKVGGKVLDGTINRDATGVHFAIEDLTGKNAPGQRALQRPDAQHLRRRRGRRRHRHVRLERRADHRRPAPDQVPEQIQGVGLTRSPVDWAVKV